MLWTVNNYHNHLIALNIFNTFNIILSLYYIKINGPLGAVNDVAFPEGCPDLIVTSSKGDIRIWNTRMKQEILRIQVCQL